MTVVITRGLQGSGKSTWAKEKAKSTGCKRVNRDELRLMLDNEQFNPDNESFVSLVENSIIIDILMNGYNLIIDSMNLNKKHLDKRVKYIKRRFPNAIIRYQNFFDVPLEECIKRDSKRETPIGEEVIRRTYDRYKDVIEGE